MRATSWRVYNVNTRRIVFRTPSHKEAMEKLAELGQEYAVACHWYNI